MVKVQSFYGFDSTLERRYSWFIGVDSGRNWPGVDVVIYQCGIAQTNVGYVVIAFVKSGPYIEDYECNCHACQRQSNTDEELVERSRRRERILICDWNPCTRVEEEEKGSLRSCYVLDEGTG